MTKLRIVVVFGGKSGEHEVSVISANSVIKALNTEKYEVLTIGITKSGRWLYNAQPDQVLETGCFDSELIPVALIADPEAPILLSLTDQTQSVGEFDVIFPVLHGPFGEDGTIQGLLELANIPYVGSGVLGSAAGMDKIVMKSLFAQAGLQQARFMAYTRSQLESTPESVFDDIESQLGYPCFVKPANMGSSLGISKACNRSELNAAFELAAVFDRRIIVEEFIDARELEVSILGNENPRASIIGEIVPSNDFYDYKAKYISGDSSLIIPAILPEETAEYIRTAAIKAFQVLDCAGLARVDFFVTNKDGRVLINEVNTLPGFTNISMYPKLWDASGITYSDLLDQLIIFALERHVEKNRSQTSLKQT